MKCQSLNSECKILLDTENIYYVIYNKSNSKFLICKNCFVKFKKILETYNNYQKTFTIING